MLLKFVTERRYKQGDCDGLVLVREERKGERLDGLSCKIIEVSRHGEENQVGGYEVGK